MSVFCRFVVCVTALGVIGPAGAQPAGEFPYLAAVTADDVNIRAGADFRYYPFGRVNEGDIVKVTGEKSGWARIATVGPAFAGFFGYVKHPKTETGHFRLSADGRSGVTLGPTDLFAPNLDARYDARSSWKPVMRLPAEKTLRVLATVEAKGDLVHKVALPPQAEGWISVTLLRRATAAEAAAWEAAMTPKPKRPPVEQPAAEPAPLTQLPVGRDLVAPLSAGPPIPAPADETTAATQKPGPPRVAAIWGIEDRRARVELSDLESAYARLVAGRVEEAEVAPLRLLYLDLAQEHRNVRAISEFARMRAEQLQLWSEVQARRVELARLSDRARRTALDAQAARLALERAGDFLAIGRLEASIVYDGERLPKLLRLREPVTGRTIGYLHMDEMVDEAAMIGQVVGIVGEKSYDGGLRVNLFHPKRIDVLIPDVPTPEE